jgi:uncharacterized protein YdeI (YjbR/CyaY-like superfamily)
MLHKGAAGRETRQPENSPYSIELTILTSLIHLRKTFTFDAGHVIHQSKHQLNFTAMSATFFETEYAFRKWLEVHHEKESELIVGFYKLKSGRPSMTWSQSVDHALCYGWIDGIRRSIDSESYSIRFTPRRKSSIWSTINIKKVEELTRAGLMHPAGLKAYSYRTEGRSEIYSSGKENVSLDDVYEKQFREDVMAWDFFVNQAPYYKKAVIHWIMRARQEKTRQSRLKKTIHQSRQQKRLF